MKTKKEERWALGVAAYPHRDIAKIALEGLKRRGLRRAVSIHRTAGGKLVLSEHRLTTRLSLAGALIGLVLGLFEMGVHLLPGGTPPALPEVLWICAFTAFGAAAGWTVGRLDRGRVDPRLVERYARWVLREETFVLVETPRARMREAFAALQEAGREPATFMIRPRRAELRGAAELPPAPRMSLDRLREHAAALAAVQRVTKGTGRRPAYLKTLRENARLLQRAREDLTDASHLEQALSPSAEWLLDNTYIVEGLIHEVERNLPRKFYEDLPVLEGSPEREPRIHRLASELVSGAEVQVDRRTLAEFIEVFQRVAPLTMGELWAFPLMIRLRLVEELRRLAVLVSRRQFEREQADVWANRLLTAAHREPEDLLFILSELAREVPRPQPHFAVRLTGQLRDEASALIPVENWLERKIGLSLQEIVQQEKGLQARHQVSIANTITSMRELSKLDWKDVFEEVCLVEKALRDDPTGIYPRMDFDTSDQYRHAVEEIARYSETSELDVTSRAIELAEVAGDADGGRRGHVGYWLVDSGRAHLEELTRARPPLSTRCLRWIRRRHAFFYLTTLVVVTALVEVMACSAALTAGASPLVTAVIALLALIPASELAIQGVNYAVTRLLPPRRLPSMRFRHGIPADCRTLVVVPVILQSREGIEDEVERLEIRHLANNDPNLLFGLLSDFPDAPEEQMPEDQVFLDTARHAIERLNARYARGGSNRFFLFHRDRRWSESEGLWMGWERKRGKIEQLNRLLNGDRSPEIAGMVRTGDPALLEDVRFVITLDSDTQLPPGTARRMVETLAHPLCAPRLSDDGCVVKEGYTIIQPRVSTSLPSANATLFSRLFTDANGTDPYTHVVSDVYQDLTGEGSYHGKGIYDVRMFHKVLTGRFPDATLLSHDLLEGAYARVGYASDIELLDLFPTSYISWSARHHRWIRGDWQIAGWLLPRVPAAGGKSVPNPLSAMNRWKILDNLRRSLAPPCMLLYLAASWWLPPPAPAFASFLILASAFFPVLAGFLTWATGRPFSAPPPWKDSGRAAFREALGISLLPHEAELAADAVARSAWRKLVSRRKLLEWQTAQMVQAESPRRRRRFLVRASAASAVAAAIGAAAIIASPSLLAAALPFVLVWACAPLAGWALNQSPRSWSRLDLDDDEREYLRGIARQTWRYFDDFVGPRTGWLPPDNFQEALRVEIAMRTSPTNIGLWVLSCLSARDLGYITTEDFIERCARTLEKTGELQKHEGHLYNWYDLTTFEPLRPRYVSTVDSGNLLSCLWAYPQGIEDTLTAPVIEPASMRGLCDTLSQLEACPPPDPSEEPRLRDLTARLRGALGGEGAGLLDLLERIRRACEVLAVASFRVEEKGEDGDFGYWLEKLRRETAAWNEAASAYLSWADHALGKAGLEAGAAERLRGALESEPFSIRALARGDHPAIGVLSDLCAEAASSGTPSPGLEEAARGLLAARDRAERTASRAGDSVIRARALADAMNLRFLYDEEKKLFVIGADVGEGRRDNSHYDLLASEARLTSFVAVASGQVPLDHWVSLGRQVGSVEGRRVLLSWSGSMFEYFMPLLLQRTYPNSLLEHACRAAAERQIEYGKKRGIPWGISESAYSGLDLNHIYQYRAFGVPGLGLKRGLEKDLVVAPYATMLAVSMAPKEAIENLKRLTAMGVRGRRGFYEAIDYTRQGRRDGDRGVIVYAYLSHHQGMSLISLDNALNDEVHRWRFHADPRVRAVVPLLFERVPVAPSVLAPAVEERSLGRLSPIAAEPALSRFDTPFTAVPRTHLLSNGSYAVMVSNAGGGYSRWRDIDITRWRADTTRDAWGSFVYVKDLDAGIVWSTAYQPARRLGKRYQVHFMADRAELRRKDGEIDTHADIVVSSDDDAEIRRVTVINRSSRRRGIELTSYSELVLAQHAADRAHPAFVKMFVQTEALPEMGALLAWRRIRSAEEPRVWVAHLAALRDPDPRAFEFETDRARFIGRGRGLESPVAMERGLGRSAGHVLDPIFSVRRRLDLEPSGRAQIAFVTIAAESREKALELIEKYRHYAACERALDVSWVHAQLELRYLGIQPEDGQRFQQLASHLLYPNPRLRPPPQKLRRNVLPLRRLWAQGISGDLPIVVVTVEDADDVTLVREVLLAHRYWRERGLKVDLVLLNREISGYEQSLQNQLAKLIQVHSHRMGVNVPGGVYLRIADQLPEEEVTLLLTAARATLAAARGTLAQQMGSWADPAELPPPLQIRDAPAQDPPLALHEIDLRFMNGSGGFTQDGREYVVLLRGAQETPAPWVNVLANSEFGALVSESGAGFAWYGNSQSNRLTAWSNDPVKDEPSDALYIRDEDTGEYWSPTPRPVRGSEEYRTRHGQGYTVFEHASHGLRQELTVFVPVDEKGGSPVRVSRLRIRNVSSRRRRLAVTSYVEWTLGADREDTQLHVFTNWDVESGALLARNVYQDEQGNRVAFAALGPPASTFTADRAEFLGPRGTISRPASLDREALSGRTYAGLDSCAALQTSVQLEPGDTVDVLALLGQASGVAEARQLVRSFVDPRRAEEALSETRAFWERTLGAIQVETPDRALNFLLDRWLLYQTLSCRVWARSAFYQSGGAFGFRDQLQDVLALLHAAPRLARDHILKAASRQFVEGDVQHWWHPISGAGVRTRFSDDALWLPYAAAAYVRATGDEALLDARAPFLEGRPLEAHETEAYLSPTQALEDGTVFEHCRRAVERAYQLGPRGLPRIGSGDWNDGFNRVGPGGRGESVWLAWFLIDVLRGFADLAELKGEDALAARSLQRAEALADAVDARAWDGEWYTRAYFDDGTPLGSKDSAEARIDSIAQSWAAITGAGDPDRARAAMQAVDKQLVRERDRLVLLFTPPFERSAQDPGYVKSYPPGVRENGGQYTHAAVWAGMAFARLGNGDRAAAILGMASPIEHTRSPEDVLRYKVEPYAVAADIYSLPERLGQGGWTWYTGSSGWLYKVWIEEVLGLRIRAARLDLKPAIPADWAGFTARIAYRSSSYEVIVENPDRVSTGIGWVELDGERLEGASVPLEDDGGRHEVRVRMEKPSGEAAPAAPPRAMVGSRPERSPSGGPRSVAAFPGDGTVGTLEGGAPSPPSPGTTR